MKSTFVFACGLLLVSTFSRAQQSDSSSPAVLPAKAAIAKLEADIPSLLQQADVPGLNPGNTNGAEQLKKLKSN